MARLEDFVIQNEIHGYAINTLDIGNITIPQGYMISLSVTEYYHEWGDVVSPDGNETSADGGSYSGLFSDHMILTKESGMVSYNYVSQYGGWDDLTLDMDLRFYRFWETTDVTITILYSFIPVVTPVQ